MGGLQLLTIASMSALVGRACNSALSSASAFRVSSAWEDCEGPWVSGQNIAGMEQSMFGVSDSGSYVEDACG